MASDVTAYPPVETSLPAQFNPDYSTASAETGTHDDHLCIAVERNYLWKNGQSICAKLIGGTGALHCVVKQAAKEWEKYANITFSFVLDGHSDIRISFMEGKGSHSVVGTKALEVRYAGLSTMNLDIAKQGSSIQFATVLHELGHVLGCVHEHCSPAANIQWDRDAVYAHYVNRGWNTQRVDDNVLRTYQPEEIQCSSPADFNSIMMYDFHQSLANGPLPTNPNLQLSIEDRKFISSVYPKPKPPNRTTTWPTPAFRASGK